METYKITDIRQAVKNENRVNIFINNQYEFSLDIAQVVELGVKIGLVVTPEQLEEYKKASEYGKVYQRTLEWVLVRPRSVREVRDYLRRKNHEEYFDPILARLEKRGYVDDRKFAEYYVENRFVKKGVSGKRLRQELMQKGVAKEVIDEVLDSSERDEAEEIKKMLARKRSKYDDQKLTAYLCRQGFAYDLVRELVTESSCGSGGSTST